MAWVIFALIGLCVDGWRGMWWGVLLGPIGILIAVVRRHQRKHKEYLFELELNQEILKDAQKEHLDFHPPLRRLKGGRLR